MRSLLRLLTILRVVLRHGLDQLALGGAARTFDSRLLSALFALSHLGRKPKEPRLSGWTQKNSSSPVIWAALK